MSILLIFFLILFSPILFFLLLAFADAYYQAIDSGKHGIRIQLPSRLWPLIKPKELHESLTTDEDTQLGVPIGNNDSAKQDVILVNNMCELGVDIMRQESNDSLSYQSETIIQRGISSSLGQLTFHKGDVACRDKHGKEVLHEFDHGARVQLVKSCQGKNDGRMHEVGYVSRRTACFTILNLEDGTEIRRASKNLTLLSVQKS